MERLLSFPLVWSGGCLSNDHCTTPGPLRQLSTKPGTPSSDPPLVKLTILGDYLWLKHYHTDLDVQTMPEYVFLHNLDDHGLYNLFYQYFMQRWDHPEIPEYDFDTDELVYRGHQGNEIIRERFGMG